MDIKNIATVSIGILAILGALAFFGISVSHSAKLGSTGNAAETYTNSQWLVGGIQIGPTGTLNANTQFGTCNLIGGAAGIAASSTANFDCAVTGIQKGDTILGDPSALEPTGNLYNFPIVKAVASSTAGYITFTVANFSGAASTTLGVPITNGVEYVSWR